MMPFFHLRDPFHYRPWLRGLLKAADRVLCLNTAMKSFVEARWGGRAHFLGGGIDPEEFDSPISPAIDFVSVTACQRRR